MGIKISVQMAIMSHLSDAQELSEFHALKSVMNHHIDFVKQLVLTYTDTSVEVEEEELNEIWRKVAKDYRSTE